MKCCDAVWTVPDRFWTPAVLQAAEDGMFKMRRFLLGPMDAGREAAYRKAIRQEIMDLKPILCRTGISPEDVGRAAIPAAEDDGVLSCGRPSRCSRTGAARSGGSRLTGAHAGGQHVTHHNHE